MPFFIRRHPLKLDAYKEPYVFLKGLHTCFVLFFASAIKYTRATVPINAAGIFGICELLSSFGLNFGELASTICFVTSRKFLPYYELMSLIIIFIMYVIGKILQIQVGGKKMESEFYKNETLSNYTNASLYFEDMQGYNSSHEFQNQTVVVIKSQNTRNDDLVNLPFINIFMHAFFALCFSYEYFNLHQPAPEDAEQGTNQVIEASGSIPLIEVSGSIPLIEASGFIPLINLSVANSPEVAVAQGHRVQIAVQPSRIRTPEPEELDNQDAQIDEPLIQPANVDMSSNEGAAANFLPGQSRNDPAQVNFPRDQLTQLESVL